ncbi:MAG: hypothetical protein LUO86_05045 [Methanomicrobiales archaeon]|nr:hypothetical protein [Methanomicrobiales archaeon]
MRMGVAAVADRWLRARRAMRKEDQHYAGELAAMAKRHASEGFYAFDDPLEAALFSVLVELLKERDREPDLERDQERDREPDLERDLERDDADP